jgi:hypothetical protein
MIAATTSMHSVNYNLTQVYLYSYCSKRGCTLLFSRVKPVAESAKQKIEIGAITNWLSNRKIWQIPPASTTGLRALTALCALMLAVSYSGQLIQESANDTCSEVLGTSAAAIRVSCAVRFSSQLMPLNCAI